MLEVLVHKRRDTRAARRSIRKFLSCQGAVPRVMVTDKPGYVSHFFTSDELSHETM